MLKTQRIASSSSPLVSLTGAVIDIETTSLDVRQARVIEIGAVALVGGVLRPEWKQRQLVNPGMPIPAGSSAIHGITDDKVAAAPAFAPAYRAYREFAGDQLVVGYSLGFDLGVLKAEHERNAMPWKAPRRLDVRDLVRILNPPLPDHSLDQVAAWLGIAVSDRHSAVGDAVAAAEILLALLPRLRSRGIRTLAEAEDACRKMASAADPPPGWHEPASADLAAGALARVDSYPYRHRVGDVMAKPPLTIAAHETLKAALDRLVDRKTSSLFVPPVRAGGAFGIVTERDILRAIAADPGGALVKPVESAASFPLVTVSADDFLYTAFGRMRRKRYRHLGVTDATGAIVGALTQRDLLHQRADDAIALSDALGEAAGVRELASVWRKLSDAARSLLAEDVDARDIAAIVSGEVCNLTARAADIAAAELGSSRPRHGSFAVMVLGSGGRGESLLAMDQDNAIVFEGDDGDWLAPFAARMNGILDEIGVPLCKGGVMAKNQEWRKSSADWRKHVSGWLSRSDPADILNSDIFFDAVPVHGNSRLAHDLIGDAIAAASQSTPFLKLMALGAAAAAAEPPLGWFGRFKLGEDGRMDLKRGGLLPIVGAARAMALKHRIGERSTAARLDALRGQEGVPGRTIDRLLEAHSILLEAILRQQLDDIERGRPPSSLVDPKRLSQGGRDRLRWALEQVPSVRDLLGDPVG